MSNHDGMRRKGESRWVLRTGLAVLLAVFAGGLVADAATFTVNNRGDGPDANPGDGVAEITTGSGTTTLRAAIEEANAWPEADTIVFNLTGNNLIDVPNPLPPLTDALGTTIAGNRAVTVNGDNAGVITPVCFTMESGNNVVRGILITGFDFAVSITGPGNTVLNCDIDDSTSAGIRIASAGNRVANSRISTSGVNGIVITGAAATGNTVEGCVIGGTLAQGNLGMGLTIAGGAAGNLVGGLLPTTRNIITANQMYGIRINGAGTTDNRIQGNFIGLDQNQAPVPNVLDGIVIENGATGNYVGATDAEIVADTVDAAANVISGNTNSGVSIAGAGGNFVRGNLIGVDAAGTAGIPNGGHGVLIASGAAQNFVGHVLAGNVIAANTMYGVNIVGVGSMENQVIGNLIGTNETDDAGLGNQFSGIAISGGASLNRVGGVGTDEGNVVSGNTLFGVEIAGAGTNFNVVLGNRIGTTADGLAALPNGGGVRVAHGAKLNQIGAEPFGSRNIISGNLMGGVEVSGAGTNDNSVKGNYIGLDVTGTAEVGNQGVGLTVAGGAMNTVVGGVERRERNLISGNAFSGIAILNTGTSQNRFLNNYIGLDWTGVVSIPNGESGIVIDFGASNNQIGGTVPKSHNVIATNPEDGIQVAGAGTTGNQIIGNYIGVNNRGELGYGNGRNGITILGGATDTAVGGTAPGAGNLIAGNIGNGIEADGATTVRARFIGNSIFSNAGRGIVLSNGANGGILPPVFADLLPVSGTTVPGSVVQFFIDAEDEGKTFVGQAVSDASGNFTSPLDATAYAGMNLTATVTRDGTSEFSFPVPITAPAIAVEPQDLVVFEGDPATFTVTLVRPDPLMQFRWQYWDGAEPANPVFVDLTDGPIYLGATTASLTILAAAESDEGFYRCQLENPLGQLTTRQASLAVFPKFADTAVINTLSDVSDGITTNLAWIVAFPGPDGRISVREAIEAANNTAAPVRLSVEPALVAGGPGTAVVNLLSLLPTIAGAGLTLDGGGLLISGAALGGSASGLEIRSANNTLAQLGVANCPGAGIRIAGSAATNNTVHSCVLTLNGAEGIRIDSAANSNLIGGIAPNQGNVLVGNVGAGILIRDAFSNGNVVQGNFIGLYPDLGAEFGNGVGVEIRGGASSNLIGGTEAGAGNVIAHNTGSGVRIADTPSVRNQIRRNSIHANGGDGINIRNLANSGIQPPVLTGFGSITGTAQPSAIVELFLDSADEGETYLDTVVAAGDGSFTSGVDVSAFLNLRVTATATDANGNTSRFSAPLPIDQTPPVITLVGAATLTLECVSGYYVEPGAVALDNVDGDISGDIAVRLWLSGVEVAAIDTTAAPLTYTVTYDVTDSAGNAATQVARTVNVLDSGAPVISLNGGARVVVALGGTYTDPGAVATDLCEGNLTASILTYNPVNTNVLGEYTVTYDVEDSAGNAAVQKRRTVSVLESTGVTLTLNGPALATTECGMPYVEAGATAIDEQGNDISDRVVITGTVDTSAVGGSFTLFYDATDAAGNPAPTVMRTVQVVDEAGPDVTLIGGSTVETPCYSLYQDAGAVAIDACEGDLSYALEMTSTVDTSTPGSYQVRYTATDSRGNASSVVRTVVVLECNSECALQCANEENPVDGDGDGLTQCVEDCLGISDANPDSDGDGMPDAFEVNNGLDPRVPDADGDLDLDAIANLDEFLDGSHPGDRNSPKRTVFVAENGTDLMSSGSYERPYATVGYALARIFNPRNNPTRIVVFEGSYPGDLVLAENADIVGMLGQTVEILGSIQGANNSQLINLTLLGDTGDEALLDMTDAVMTVRGVSFLGGVSRPGVGILADGTAPAESVIEGCAFASLNAGIEIWGATPLIRDCAFAEMSIAGVVFRSGANVGSNDNGVYGDTGTGWNIFDLESMDGPAVLNLNAATAVMEINDWGTDSAAAIQARIQGPVDFISFLGAGTGGRASTVYVTVWDAKTQVRIENARITLLGEEFDSVTENRNGVYTFALVPGQEFTVEVRARGYQTRTMRFDVAPGQRRSLIVPLQPRKSAIISCHAGTEDSGTALGLTLPALVAMGLLVARARRPRKHTAH